MQKEIPFIEKYEIDYVDKQTARVRVHEKRVTGCVIIMGRYMFFDKDGIIVETSMARMEGIPVVSGLEFNEIVLELKKLIVAMNQQNAQECFLYYQEVLKDISLCLENPSLSYEERLRLIDKEIEVALIVGKKESELREMNRMILEGEK